MSKNNNINQVSSDPTVNNTIRAFKILKKSKIVVIRYALIF